MLASIKTRLILLMGLLSCTYGFAGADFDDDDYDTIGCPYGCATATDPDVIQIGHELVKALKAIQFLQHTITVSDTDGSLFVYDEGQLTGMPWHIQYEAEYAYESYEDDWDEDTFEWIEEYIFSRDLHDSNGHSCFVTNLNNFLETSLFSKYILLDLDCLAQARQRDHLENIARYHADLKYDPFSAYLKDEIASEKTLLIQDAQTYSDYLSFIESLREKIQSMYRKIFDFCIRTHRSPLSFYYRGLLNFNSGQFIEAFNDVSRYLHQEDEDLISEEAYFYRGVLQSEIGAYRDAVTSLSAVIKSNPQHTEAYFERACAYFELGEFDRSLSDYLKMGNSIRPATPNLLPFSLGLTKGIVKGGAQAGLEFIPSTLASLHGLSQGLWAFALHPVTVSTEFVTTLHGCINFVKTHSFQDVCMELVPELRELIEKWDVLSDEARGELSGVIVGKYGLEIFAVSGATKIVHEYRNLKRANNLLTLEAIAAAPENATLIRLEALKRAQCRQEVLRRGNLKIQWDKQGKHIEGHRNFIVTDKPSRLVHPDPQRLVDDFAGKGLKLRGEIPGAAGYQEAIDFKEFIGYAVDRSGRSTATTWGKIHYANDGVHIVPRYPGG